ncbi:metallophosphoesterase family protein [Rhizobium ruizarguesonis]|uniref:metallophosphoesterase family protein n=1 Tax=Rhizobium ruizarguesonis TaxID=2081791 RepID=UPI0013EF22AA|nr:metallophosphoesterase [Rhizobium ruizarguesonis]
MAFAISTGSVLSETEHPIGILLAAGDIAYCETSKAKDEEVAKVVQAAVEDAQAQGVPIRLLALGDLAYSAHEPDGEPSATKEKFDQCFDPNWGKFKSIMLPVPGNHDQGAHSFFFEYFKDNDILNQNGAKFGYYSIEFGDSQTAKWALFGLNAYSPSLADELIWLRAKLHETKARCVLAFMHPFQWSSGNHGHNDEKSRSPVALKLTHQTFKAFDELQSTGASILLTAHDHDFEQFEPIRADGTVDLNGIRSFVVGTGGANLYRTNPKRNCGKNEHNCFLLHAASVVFSNKSRGVLKLTLYPARYEWDFLPIAGEPDIELEKVNGKPGADCNLRSTP